jgi:hypothetical protein
MLSSGMQCYHLGPHVIIWDKMLSSGANVIMVSSGANVIIWCYHVMLSSGMITHTFYIFPENFTHSRKTSLQKTPRTIYFMFGGRLEVSQMSWEDGRLLFKKPIGRKICIETVLPRIFLWLGQIYALSGLKL